jgi:hypothetical protein
MFTAAASSAPLPYTYRSNGLTVNLPAAHRPAYSTTMPGPSSILCPFVLCAANDFLDSASQRLFNSALCDPSTLGLRPFGLASFSTISIR